MGNPEIPQFLGIGRCQFLDGWENLAMFCWEIFNFFGGGWDISWGNIMKFISSMGISKFGTCGMGETPKPAIDEGANGICSVYRVYPVSSGTNMLG